MEVGNGNNQDNDTKTASNTSLLHYVHRQHYLYLAFMRACFVHEQTPYIQDGKAK